MPLDRSPAGCSHTGGLRQDTEEVARGDESARLRGSLTPSAATRRRALKTSMIHWLCPSDTAEARSGKRGSLGLVGL